ncbi:Uncharacterized conserved protein YbjT, contains NAD(P)-binding and DUF2867 domains [Lentzea fradiae]|uniref:Uncharacterized conserved protein YbjT, contains NAD(P)-binding and DUF2867 domains n=1 Tax=Lentzea fradiae TaxID=200378 RepID=A0A1G7KQX1_9PSEU|nr:DUF2867 domain-containing protein [Lentzea fradiae]SDF39474.1 Uncharacterized conserved protein YbjT, contains NAD(P)-binding and DUF2867 domains [Lentzea fradiae]
MGATGHLGSHLVPELLAHGHEVAVLVRDRAQATRFPTSVLVHSGDATDRRAVGKALAGTEVVYFLVHSLDRPDFADVDRAAATVLAEAAQRAEVRQVVYVGGPRPDGPGLSPHLRSRAEVGDVVAAGRVPALVLRTPMVIGAGSASFELLRSSARLSPWVPVPSWMHHTSRPVGVADVVHFLVASAHLPEPVDGAFDVLGPERLSYLDLVQRCARVLRLPVRVPVPSPLWSHKLAAQVAGLLTPVSATVAEPLLVSLDHDLGSGGTPVTEVLPAPPGGLTSVDNAIRAAIDPPDEETGGEVFTEEQTVLTDASPDDVWRTVSSLGGDEGWHTIPLVWTVRGAVDHLLGGIGLYRGRAPEVGAGDVVDFWTVVDRDDEGRRLVLRADMKMPGRTVLDMRVDREGDRTRYRQKVTFTADGLLGQLYWAVQKPLHDIVFATMAHGIVRSASKR